MPRWAVRGFICHRDGDNRRAAAWREGSRRPRADQLQGFEPRARVAEGVDWPLWACGCDFAPNPSVDVREGALTQKEYSYVRPLATIEPTAIALGLPVNTQIGFPDIAGLQQAVTAPEYANSTVFIAWEHKYAYDFARQMLKSYGLDRARVPAWPGDDFETMYVFRIKRAAGAASPTMTFAVEQEGLSASLSDACPSR